MIKAIEAESGAKVSIEQDGTIFIAAVSSEGGEIAANMIRGITQEIEVGTRFKGKVTRLMGMGAFVEFMPGKEGLVHVSALRGTDRRPDDAVKVGDEIDVRVVEVDPQGRINLSAIKLDEPYDPALHRAQRTWSGGGGGGFRGGDRDRGGFGVGTAIAAVTAAATVGPTKAATGALAETPTADSAAHRRRHRKPRNGQRPGKNPRGIRRDAEGGFARGGS